MKGLKSIALRGYKIVFKIAGVILPKKKNRIVFESFLGRQYSDNPRALYEYIIDNYEDKYDLIWSVDRRHVKLFQEKGLPYYRRFSIKWLLAMNTAGVWISNSRLPLWIPKPKKTTYLQTWHGTPLKRLALDMDEVHMPGTNTERYKKNFTTESSKWDYLVSPNHYSTEIFERAFDFKQTMLETGYPRNDYLVNFNDKDYIHKLKVDLGIPRNKKIMLYAPTWRDNEFYGRGRYKFDIQLDLDKMKETLGDEYIILLRMHYLIAENINVEKYEGFVIDFSSYEDIRDLYLVSDILLTDYSSVFFDYAILNRPMYFFTYDLESYRDTLRGFYFDFEKDAPGPLLFNTSEVIDAITSEEDAYYMKRQSFRNTYTSLEDGLASERVIKRVLK